MALREIISIDEDKCDGCGQCAKGCPEGALRIIEGKARLVGESLCDGLGACIGECPRGAITIEKREAAVYEETRVIEGMVRLGPSVVAAHLEHLAHHGQDGYEREALAWLAARGLGDPRGARARSAEAPACPGGAGPAATAMAGGCPGSAARRFAPRATSLEAARSLVSPDRSRDTPAPVSGSPEMAEDQPSALGHWPIQMKLVNPRAAHYAGARLLVAADCTAFALGAFHSRLLEGRSLVIACPKLDDRTGYVEKLAALIEAASSVEVAIMEVPCCGGLVKLVTEAREAAGLSKPLAVTVVGVEGGIISTRTV
jgi:NAD-dependent dihydropyrimidine dehydrogenase PreA subunit